MAMVAANYVKLGQRYDQHREHFRICHFTFLF